MDKQPPDYDDRLEQQYKRLGTREPRCVCCNESNAFCLELHHIAGQKHHNDLSIVCRNCHRKLSNQQLDHAPKSAEPADRKSATIGHYILGLCDLLALIIETLREFGKWLIETTRKQPT